MLFRLVRPMRRRGSANHYFVQRIPADVRDRAAGMRLEVPIGEEFIPATIAPRAVSVRLSLRTSDPAAVKVRQAQVAGYLEAAWQSLRESRPVSLTHRQATALAGKAYRAWAEEREQTTAIAFDREAGAWQDLTDHAATGGPGLWHAARERALSDGSASKPETDLAPRPEIDPERTLGATLDGMLRREGIFALAPPSRSMALEALAQAKRDGMAAREKQAGGDYRPDPNAGRFPAWEAPREPGEAARESISLTGLIEGWWKEAKTAGRTVSTYESYRSAFARLHDFLGHDDARKVTAEDVVRFKDHRLAQGVSPKTVGDSDLAALRSVFAWAVSNLKVDANPAAKVRVARAKAVRTRPKHLLPEEAAAILAHCLAHEAGRERPKTAAAKRWVPWLCAYTGARLGEVVQLRREDVREVENGVWTITITPEAGTVKDKEAREVVLHEHLVALGFVAFVQGSRPGHLFLAPGKGGEVRGAWRTTKNRVREFVREVVKDKSVAPNHGWRHLFKTVGREAGIADSVLDAICGHAPGSVGGSYGGVTIRAQCEAMAKFPRFVLAGQGA